MPRRRRVDPSASLARAVAAGLIPPLSNHALHQAIAREVTAHDIASAIERGSRYRQPDAARVFVRRLYGRGRFYVVVGENDVVVTVSRKNLTLHEVRRASIRHRWQR